MKNRDRWYQLLCLFVEKKRKILQNCLPYNCFGFSQRTDSYNNVTRFPKLWEGDILYAWEKKKKEKLREALTVPRTKIMEKPSKYIR